MAAAPEGTPSLDLSAPPPDGSTTIAVVPVYVQTARHDDNHKGRFVPKYRLLALVPLSPPGRPVAHVFGTRRDDGASRRGRRESMVDVAADLAAGMPIPREAFFLAGEVRTHDGGGVHDRPVDDSIDADTDGTHAAADTIVVTAPAKVAPRAVAGHIVESGAALRAAAAAGLSLAWVTIDAVAEACAMANDGERCAAVARYRVVAAAILRVDSYLQPTPEGPAFLRIGARDERVANRSTVEHDAARTTLSQRLVRCAAASKALQQMLLDEPHNAKDPSFSDWCRELAPSVITDPGLGLPPELSDYVLPAAPSDLLGHGFQHVAVVAHTEPLPVPQSQRPPPGGWMPNDITDILTPEALLVIKRWLRANYAWHKCGGHAQSRPDPIALGTESIQPRARGYIWDLRGGPGHVRLFDPATEPKRTCIDLAFAEEIFADCADRELVSMLLHGVQMKTEGLAHQIVLMPNLLSLYTSNGGVDAAADQFDDMARDGFLGLFSCIPSVPFRACPRGEVAKKGTAELRGICDQGSPRKRLRTSDAGDEAVVPLNDESSRADWPRQGMDGLEGAALNGAIVQELADLNGETCIELAFDYSKYFWRFFMNVLSLWQHGCIVPGKDDSILLRMALEYVMTMGAFASSAIAQRFSSAVLQLIYKIMHAQEAARWADPELTDELTPACRAALVARGKLTPSCYGTQAAMFNLLQYCDDARFCVAGPARCMRLLRIFHGLTGPAGLRLPLSRAQKQQTGSHVVWLGGVLAAGLGLVWIPPDKCVRAAHSVAQALRGEIDVGTYRSVLGFLASLVFMMGGDKTLLHHIFRPINANEELGEGPATLVVIDDHMRPVLTRWLDLLLNTPGSAMVAAARPSPPPTVAPRHRIRTDAAKETDSGGIGGWLYGLWFGVSSADEPGLMKLDIPHLELIAAGVGVLIFGPTLVGARHVCVETDALATATTLTARAHSPAMRAILDTLLEFETYRALAPRLTIIHCWGAGNPMGDAASRSYVTTMAVLSEALGMPATRLPLNDEAHEFVRLAIRRAAPLVRSAQQPRRGATDMGASNPHMDGSPRAHGGSSDDEAPSPPMRLAVVSFGGGCAGGGGTRTGGDAGGRAPPGTSASVLPGGRQGTPTRRRSATGQSPDTPTMRLPSVASRGADFQRDPPRRLDLRDGAIAAIHDGRGDAISPAPSSPTAMRLTTALAPVRRAQSPDARPKHRGGSGANMVALRAAREQRAEDVYAILRDDESAHAVHADDDVLRWMAEYATVGDSDELPLNSQSQRASNWKHWRGYCDHLRMRSPWRPDAASLDDRGRQRENAIWAYALPFILKRMHPRPGYYLAAGPPHFGCPRPPQPQSALNVLRGVRAEMMARGITPPPLQLATRRCHEMMLKYMREFGQQNLVEQRKAPLSHLLITRMLSVPEGAPILKRKQPWTWKTQYGCSTSALFHTLAQTGFRKAEISLGKGATWDDTMLAFSNLRWKIRGKTVHVPTVAQLNSLADGDYAIIMPPPSKSDQYGRRWGNNPIWLPVDPTAAINAALHLAQWELCACVSAQKRGSTPLFCGPSGVGSPLKASQIDDVFHRLLARVVDESDDAKNYSMHSWRSFLASSLMAAGCSDAQIQAALRWASEDALKIYKVANHDVYGGWLRSAEGVKLTGERAITLQADMRALPVTEPEQEIELLVATGAAIDRAAGGADATDLRTVSQGGVEALIESLHAHEH